MKQPVVSLIAATALGLTLSSQGRAGVVDRPETYKYTCKLDVFREGHGGPVDLKYQLIIDPSKSKTGYETDIIELTKEDRSLNTRQRLTYGGRVRKTDVPGLLFVSGINANIQVEASKTWSAYLYVGEGGKGTLKRIEINNYFGDADTSWACEISPL